MLALVLVCSRVHVVLLRFLVQRKTLKKNSLVSLCFGCDRSVVASRLFRTPVSTTFRSVFYTRGGERAGVYFIFSGQTSIPSASPCMWFDPRRKVSGTAHLYVGLHLDTYAS